MIMGHLKVNTLSGSKRKSNFALIGDKMYNVSCSLSPGTLDMCSQIYIQHPIKYHG